MPIAIESEYKPDPVKSQAILDRAIAAGRLTPEPAPEVLLMIARMIRPILREQVRREAGKSHVLEMAR